MWTHHSIKIYEAHDQKPISVTSMSDFDTNPLHQNVWSSWHDQKPTCLSPAYESRVCCQMFIQTVPSLVLMCRAFPPLCEDVTSLLVQIARICRSQLAICSNTAVTGKEHVCVSGNVCVCCVCVCVQEWRAGGAERHRDRGWCLNSGLYEQQICLLEQLGMSVSVSTCRAWCDSMQENHMLVVLEFGQVMWGWGDECVYVRESSWVYVWSFFCWLSWKICESM